MEPSYWVVAEIAELRVAAKGHCYLDLVEKHDHEIIARLRANIWAYQYRNISSWFESVTSEPLRSGMEVLCRLSVNFHAVFGLSLTITDIDPAYTLGAREKKKRDTIERLRLEGILDMNKMNSLPLVPQRIAVISSPSAAGYGDFINQLESNGFGFKFRLELFPAVMQGDEAPASIISALYRIADREDEFDLVALIRGGGAQLDLDCFDNYDLCAHLAQFPLPVLTGIGHDRDETIADLVAHTKLKTPTAVAEFLIEGMRAFLERLRQNTKRLERMTLAILKQMESELAYFLLEARNKAIFRLLQEAGILDASQATLSRIAFNKLKMESQRLPGFSSRIQKALITFLKFENRKLEGYETKVGLLDPKRILEKGYALATINGKNIVGIEHLIEPGEEVRIITKTHLLNTELTSKKKRTS